MTADLLRQIHSILVAKAGACELDCEQFIYAHMYDACTEWRFCGLLGFGGKFQSRTWMVDCYPEDETPERQNIVVETNAALAALRATVATDAKQG